MLPTSFRIARQQSLYTSQASDQIGMMRRDLALLNEQLATGRRVNRPSDDPASFSKARSLESLERQYAQYERTIGDSQYWTNSTEAELGNLSELFTQAYEEGLKGMNDTNSTEEREILATRIEELLAESIDSLNAKAGGEYLFAGNRTTTQPFDDTGAAAGDLSGERLRQIAPGVEVRINIPGSRVIDRGDGTTITDSLQALADALRSEDQTAMQEALDGVITSRDHLIGLTGEVGGIARRLSDTEARLQDASLEATRRRSAVENADLAQTITSFQRTQTMLEAALRSTASIQQTTLLNYLS